MSYSIIVDFYGKKDNNFEYICGGVFDELKTVNNVRYDVEFEHIENITPPFESNGQFFNEKSFVNAAEYYRREIEKKKIELENLPIVPSLPDIDFSDFENKDAILERIRETCIDDLEWKRECLEEEIEHLEWCIITCEKMIGLFSFFSYCSNSNKGGLNYYKEVVACISAN